MAKHSARTRAALAAATALSLVMGTAACSSGGSSDSSGGGKSFTYWSMWKQGEPAQKVLAAAIKDFEKKTGDTVNVQWTGRNNMQKLTPTLNTDDVPDLVDAPVTKAFPTLAATQQALGLKSAWADKTADGEKVSSVIPAKYLKDVDIKLADGQPWMVPYNIKTDGVWFNATKYPELKTNPPKTWNQFMGLLKKLKSQGGAPIAADGNVPGYNAYWIELLMMRDKGPGILKKIASDKSGQAWKQPFVLDAAKKVEQLAKGGYIIKGYTASQFPYQERQWANNKAALILMGSWLPSEASAFAAKGMVYRSFPFPTTGTHDAARIDFSGFEIPKKAKNAKAAAQFAAFFLSKKYQTMWAKEAKLIPVRSDIPVAKSLQGVVKDFRTAKSFRSQDGGILFPGYTAKVLYPIDDQLFLGKITAQQFVSKMAAAQKNYWASQS